MKKMKFIACLMAVAAVAGVALADYSPINIGLGAQFWDAKDADILDEDGFWGGNVILRFRPVELLGIDFRAGVSGVWDSDTYRSNGTKYEEDVTLSCVPLEVGLVLMIPLAEGFTLYGGPGVGYYFYDLDARTSSKHHHHYHTEWKDHVDLEDDFGWYAVAGLNIQLAPHFSIFGEGRYTDTETSVKHSSEDIDCSGFGAQAGFMFDF